MRHMACDAKLQLIDDLMRTTSVIKEPMELVDRYWEGVDALLPVRDHMAVSRRGMTGETYLVTRSSKWEDDINPWTERDKLPRLSGGLVGEILAAGKPQVMLDLAHRLTPDDPCHFFLSGYRGLVAFPQYDDGVALNWSILLVKEGENVDLNDLPLMHWHASLFGRSTQSLVLRNDLAKALNDLDRELKVVGEIQQSLLPATLPAIEGFELASFYRPSARAGGDYYDVMPLTEGKWGMIIADVSGHGTPAAVIMSVMRTLVHAGLEGTRDKPAHVFLEYLNRQMTDAYMRDGRFVTVWCAMLDPATRRLMYACAGHNPPRLVRKGKIIPLDAVGGLPVGIDGGQVYEEASIELEPGDLIVTYTDGITEAMRGRELFELERLDAVLTSCSSMNPHECLNKVRAAVEAFTGGTPPNDDQTMLVVKVK